ncbi:hypothetical protein [Agromyces sp. SYSU T00266]|uniref:hypothetical protein n=1 Tax=Agromyces zhanjiangensis TaxID=3158562 RepID=UPI0033927FC8
MPLTQQELDALTRRAELLSAKVTALEQNGFSRQEAFQILFAEIQAGMNAFGTVAPATTAGSGAPIAETPPAVPATPFDLSNLIGSWNITPTPLREDCFALQGGLSVGMKLPSTASATAIDISFSGAGQSRLSMVFRGSDGSTARAEGSASSTGDVTFEFFGEFDVSRVRLKVEGTMNGTDQEVVIRFEYEGTPGYSPWTNVGNCRAKSFPRTLVRV